MTSPEKASKIAVRPWERRLQSAGAILWDRRLQPAVAMPPFAPSPFRTPNSPPPGSAEHQLGRGNQVSTRGKICVLYGPRPFSSTTDPEIQELKSVIS